MNRPLYFLLGVTLLSAPSISAQVADVVPDGMKGVYIDQLLDAEVALDATFTDDGGNQVQIKDLLKGHIPTILTFNFTDCPTVCSTQLDALTDALRSVDLTPGEDFQIITVSLDPNEVAAKARMTKSRYTKQYGREGATRNWHFLTGDATQIRKLADSAGYHYKYVDRTAKFSHNPALIFLTPEGRICRYSAAVIYQPTTLRYSLIEASEGKIGTVTDALFLSCFRYDPAAGKYSLFATNFMKFGAVLTLLALGGFLLSMRKFESKLHGPAIGAEVVR